MGTVGTVDVTQMVVGFQERMAKLALFDPLFELQRQRKSDRNGEPIEMMEMGLLTLLFFFEQKLMRNPRASVKDLAKFLQETAADAVKLDDAAFEELARTIIQVFRPSSGKRRSFTFFNWETRQQDTAYTSILKANSFDSKTNTQYYALDDDGLELVFATKEFYMEFQLSIHQLVLRKQLEKGEFQGALRQINEMRVDVESLQERMSKLGHEIKRSIVSEDTLKKYGALLEDIYSRLQRENEEFEELRSFVKETKERIYSDTLQMKEHHAYEYILRISAELEKVHTEHTLLLQQSIELKNGALHAAKESLYYTGMDSFNFDQDIVNLLLGTPLPWEAARGVLSPFLGLEQFACWSPLTVFAEQNITADGEEEHREEGFLEPAEGQEAGAFVHWRGRLFKSIMEELLVRLEEGQTIRLSEVIEACDQREETRDWLSMRAFYDFWLILHQRSPVQAGRENTDESKPTGMKEAIRLLGKHTLIVEEAGQVIEVNARFSIQEMDLTLTLGGRDDALPE
ncbi:replicative DNA helicase [Paenibacillus thiaminolyticus]|uniref:Replicative DNA helicase n=1 Tax=Paenibacillus thiaminolyticus TaxID=49283 RepID=A0A3A3H415_PANTH|nr:replicative DNA helicase [Paenibacillus thiaminolyticus]RJG26232.1 replicative DNA helicase [Paenibacillus thiaminolyticus]